MGLLQWCRARNALCTAMRAYGRTIAMSVRPMPMAVERVSVGATSSRASSVTSDTTVTPTHASVMPGAAEQESFVQVGC